MHDLRHTYASRLVQREVPLHTVSRLLGHESLKMTLRYSHLATADLRRAVAALDCMADDHGRSEQATT
jgi:site-specific recombinase XerD